MLILVPVMFVVAATQVRDLRWMAVLLVAALAYYASARIPFREVRSNWAVVAVFVVVFAGVNGLIVGATSSGEPDSGATLFTVPLIGLPITEGAVSYAVNMLLRFIALVAVGFPLAFAIRPGDLAVAFARLGLPARFAYGIDLTFKFLPSAAANLQETAAAQRLRGYERSATRNPVRRLREIAPLMVPVTITSFVDAEDTVDALDLRGFGTAKRTWLREIRYTPADWAVTGVAVLLAAAATVASLAGLMPSAWLP
ncbi:energy-coupling factor transporter transmembrane component T [Rathayibacter oskolensis]|uniref:energy-coupling factor transporter transmembrane component T family protein n=1 Tax=Rathayibacter oskolensis TaxID=1891671 RepID=UPI00265FDC02|nr:energy-coupling factor transporter transmembrane component T [Rathayibacter oskolensis]WKK72786.1 energy-coupling factor transporter transmembrane component T [Rathayibacter oskolensis]